MNSFHIPGTAVCIRTSAKCACSAIKKALLLHIVGAPMPDPHHNGLHNAMRVFTTPMPGVSYTHYQFVRNPVDRVIDAYRDKVLREARGPFYNPGMSFSTFLTEVVSKVPNPHWRRQLPNGVEAGVTYYKIENGIQPAMDAIAAAHNLQPFTVEWVHVTPQTLPMPVLTAADKTLIAQLYGSDFALYPEALAALQA